MDYLKILVEHGSGIFFLTLTILATLLFAKWTKKAQKTPFVGGVDMARKAVLLGIQRAEHAAKKWAKEQEDDEKKKLPGEEKLKIAMEFIVAEMERQNLPEVAAEHIERMVEAELGRIEGSAGGGALARALGMSMPALAWYAMSSPPFV